jgi:L-iditol 2-dehydrogenase
MFSENSTQKSAFWYAPGKLEVKDNIIPKVIEGSVLIKIEACAVCGSDLRIYNEGNPRIKPPRIIGHEISGKVVAIGKGVSSYKVGDLISTGADVPCGQCEHCLNGRSNCCDINYALGYQFDGGFSQYMLLDPLVVKHGPIQKVNSGVELDLAALSEPLACCINGYERGLIKPESTIVVFGGGPIGLMLCLLAPIYEAKKVILIEPSTARLGFAKNNIDIISHFINPFENDPVEEIMQITDGVGADLVFTANPVAKTHEQAIEVVGKRGVVNLFGGLPKIAKKIKILSNNIHYKEAYLTGSHGSTPQQHKKALKLITDKKIQIELLITHIFPLKDIHRAFETARSGKGLKVIVKPNV